MEQIDLLTVFVSAIVALILSFIWHSLFSFSKKMEKKEYLRIYPLFFLLLLVIAYFLALIEIYLVVTSFWDGIIAGIIVWFGFVATTGFSSVLWKRNKMRNFLIDSGAWCLIFMMMGGVLAG